MADSRLTLDEADLRILETLQKNATATLAELARAAVLSPSPCWRRLQRLKAAGLIRDQITRLDAQKLGLGTVIYAGIRIAVHDRAALEAFADAVRRMPDVMECYAVAGEFDFLLRIVVGELADYQDMVLRRLSALPNVREIRSLPLLWEVKCTQALPLRRR